MEPPFPNAWFNAGFFYLKQKDFGRARECFSRYLESAEDEDEEKREEAESILKEIDESGLEDENFLEACKAIQQGHEEEGLVNIRLFLEQRPSVRNGWFVLGWALRRLGRWEDGAAAFRKALEFDSGETSNTADIQNELAICLMETEDYRGARQELETALREDPDNIKIISNLGVLAMKNGDDDEAAAFFRIVLELDPEDPVAGEY
jgi:Tfp pilus assembly protein PilF